MVPALPGQGREVQLILPAAQQVAEGVGQGKITVLRVALEQGDLLVARSVRVIASEDTGRTVVQARVVDAVVENHQVETLAAEAGVALVTVEGCAARVSEVEDADRPTQRIPNRHRQPDRQVPIKGVKDRGAED